MTASRRHTMGRILLCVLPGLGGGGAALAADDAWSVLLEPMYMDAYGHDQHVLTIHAIDSGAVPAVDSQTPVTLDNEAGPGYRLEVQRAWTEWALGLDFFWFSAGQGRPGRTAMANPSGAPDAVTFEAADRSFTADASGESVLFAVLEDTDIATWTVDLYALKRLAGTRDDGLALQFGLRNADFDNDYHSVVALENTAGSLIDASSNYGRMTGPLVGLTANVHFGRNAVRGYLGQSVVFGTAELSHSTRDFTGPVSDAPAVTGVERFRQEQDVAIPITEFRLSWLYPLSRRISLGLSANTSVWWDVPVPPGVIPIADGDEVFHENTILYFGLGVALQLGI